MTDFRRISKNIFWIYLNFSQTSVHNGGKKLEKSLKTVMFRPNLTSGYQGYQSLLYTGYHELSHPLTVTLKTFKRVNFSPHEKLVALTHYHPAMPFENSKKYFTGSFQFSIVKFQKIPPPGNLKFNNLGISKA